MWSTISLVFKIVYSLCVTCIDLLYIVQCTCMKVMLQLDPTLGIFKSGSRSFVEIKQSINLIKVIKIQHLTLQYTTFQINLKNQMIYLKKFSKLMFCLSCSHIVCTGTLFVMSDPDSLHKFGILNHAMYSYNSCRGGKGAESTQNNHIVINLWRPVYL